MNFKHKEEINLVAKPKHSFMHILGTKFGIIILFFSNSFQLHEFPVLLTF